MSEYNQEQAAIIKELRAEIARLRADAEYDQRNAAMSQAEAAAHLDTIARLRAEREELIKLADLWDQQCGRESFAPNFADELRAALAEKD